MAQHREPVLALDRNQPSISLAEVPPLTETELAGKTHVIEARIRRWEVPAGTTVAMGTYPLFTIPANWQVHSIEAVILAAFTAAVTLQIQDAAAWVLAGELSEQTPGSVASSVVSAGGALQMGKFYTAGDTIDLVIGGANTIIGEIGLVIKFTRWDRFESFDLG